MQAIRIHSYGGPEVVRVEDIPRPEPREGEILVRVRAAGVNPVDSKIRGGSMAFLHLQFPVTLGCDLAGTVEKGHGAFHSGDEVYAYTALTRNGAFAEYAIVLESELALKPKTLDFGGAASVPVAVLTAWQSLFDLGGMESGQTVLIHGAAGAVGAMAVQLAKWKGARVIGTASGSNVAYLGELGADQIIDYKKEKFEDSVHGVDLVFDTVGGETRQRSFAVLRDGGKLISTVQPPAKGAEIPRGIQATMVGVHPNGKTLTDVAAMIDAGKIKTRIDRVFPLAQAADALALSEGGHAKGKIILDVS